MPQAIFLCEFFIYLPSIHETHIIYIRYPREEKLPAIHHDLEVSPSKRHKRQKTHEQARKR